MTTLLSARRVTSPILASALLFGACSSGNSDVQGTPLPSREDARAFRAIAGVSMGGYGALNLGTKRPELFGAVCSLGGPVDMQELLRHAIDDNLEVRDDPTTLPPAGEFDFDNLPAYPDRDTRMRMMQDLFIAFGNPFLHHPDAANSYLAVDAEPAFRLMDDRYGALTLTTNGVRGFGDGGDANQDGLRQVGEVPALFTEVLLIDRGSGAEAAPAGAMGQIVDGRELFDVDGDGRFDFGDGIVLNYSEPFTDLDGDLVYEPGDGETFDDDGLDGVPGSGDFGEGNGTFDYDPDRARWLAQDPLTRLAGRSATEISEQRLYLEVGDADEFEFQQHYDNLVQVLRDKGLSVQEGPIQGSCTSIPELTAPRVYLTYQGGHVGIPAVDDSVDVLRNADFCGDFPIWRRILSMLGFLNESFRDGDFGVGGIRVVGDTLQPTIATPSLDRFAGDGQERTVWIYRPPAFFNTTRNFPIVYFLGGYGQKPEDFEQLALLLDLLIATDEVQNFYFAVLPGAGGRRGSFYVDHAIPHDQVPEIAEPTSGQYETAIFADLIPAIEDDILNGRIRR